MEIISDLDKQCARAIEFDDYLDEKRAPAVEPEPKEPSEESLSQEGPLFHVRQ